MVLGDPTLADDPLSEGSRLSLLLLLWPPKTHFLTIGKKLGISELLFCLSSSALTWVVSRCLTLHADTSVMKGILLSA